VAFSLLPNSPFFGFGTRMHLVTLGEHLGMSQRATHNTFIAVLMGTGFVGFSLFIYFYGRALLAAWRTRTEGINRVVFVWLMMASVGAFSMNMECCKWFFIVMALSLALEKLSRQNTPPGGVRT
jgi:O-antigen ligase